MQGIWRTCAENMLKICTKYAEFAKYANYYAENMLKIC
jgi:hypothetical protein